MNKQTKKTVISVIVAVLVFTGLYFGVKALNKPKVTVGDKEINIVIKNQEEEVVFEEKVNSDTERRVRFLEWSPLDTQDRKSIPESLKIKM